MKINSLVASMAFAVLACSCGRAVVSDPSLCYHFDQPARIWEETFPLGNGRIGIMPDGGVDCEKLVLNEISMWSGSPQNADNPEAVKYLPQIRELLFSGHPVEAQDLVYKTFTCSGEGSGQGHGYRKPYGDYQLFGNLMIDYSFEDSAVEVDGYRRELSLDRAVSTEKFARQGVNYIREYFVSYSDDVAVIRLSADKSRRISFALSVNRDSNVELLPGEKPLCSVVGDDLLFSGRLYAGTEAAGASELSGMKYAGGVRVIPKGGCVSEEDGKLCVKGASEAVILIAMKTDYFGENPVEAVAGQLDRASGKSFAQLMTGHQQAFGELFGRVELDFGHNTEKEALPMDKRLESFVHDSDDPSLSSLYYQFGRYLLISSTRPGCLPPNLQGLWANSIDTPWNGDYHLNINLQMNLWPAETGNLSELHLPLIEWTKSQVESGRNTARVFYGARGWVTHILGNVWQFTAPGEHPSWGATNTAGAWLCEHLYKHYLYTKDIDYLKDVYPVMRESALFFVDMLVENPKTHYLVTAPTTSPENPYFTKDGKVVSICAGSTMDNQVVRELFGNVIEAASILGVDKEFCDTLADRKARLMPTTIGEDGRIMEWLEPFDEVDVHHRHVSHLYGLYPANEISCIKTPELADAARKSLEARGDLSTGWSMAWKINFWARLHDGEHAYKLLRDLLHPAYGDKMQYSSGGGSYPNLFCAHPPFQMDGNFGGCAGISEMLIQSQTGVIELLPALPSAWKTGHFNGLCAQGGAELDVAWEDGVISSVVLRAKVDGDFMVNGLMDAPVSLKSGEFWRYDR